MRNQHGEAKTLEDVDLLRLACCPFWQMLDVLGAVQSEDGWPPQVAHPVYVAEGGRC